MLAFNTARRSNGYMPLNATDSDDRKVIAKAITNLRKARDMTQGQVAQPLGMTTQAYQKYEAAERKFTSERMTAILSALGASREALDMEISRLNGAPMARPTAPGLQERGAEYVFDIYTRPMIGPEGVSLVDAGEILRRFDLSQLIGANTGALEVPGDMLSPWAESGETLIYDRDRYPKPGMGCVIETAGGAFHPLVYERSDGSAIYARQFHPAKTHRFALADIVGVYAVRLRGG